MLRNQNVAVVQNLISALADCVFKNGLHMCPFFVHLTAQKIAAVQTELRWNLHFEILIRPGKPG
jgi:hypothetical protein